MRHERRVSNHENGIVLRTGWPCINSLVKAAKTKARGYRTKRNLIAMVYLLAGKLDLRLPT